MTDQEARDEHEAAFNSIKDRLIAATGSPGLTAFYDGKVHMTLSEWDRLVTTIEGHRKHPEPEWEYGWVSRFDDNGEEYEWLSCSSRDEAERQIRDLQEQEDTDGWLSPGRLTYSLRRRSVIKPGPWEPVPQ